MNGIFYHDGIDEEYFMSNAGYVQNNKYALRKVYTSINLSLKLLQACNRYFKEDISQSSIIAYYDN